MTDTFFADFHSQVSRFPDRIALWIEGQSITFSELHQVVTVLAQQLQATREEQSLDDVWPVYVDRSLQSAISIFSLLYAGIPFAVIDEDTPIAHAMRQIESLNFQIPLWNVSQTEVGNVSQIKLSNKSAQLVEPNMTDLAYVILTSGSTGVPKGVMHSRENILHSKSVDWFDSSKPVGLAALAVAPFSYAMGMNGLLRLRKGISYYNLKPKNYTPRQFFEIVKQLQPTHVSFPAQFARLFSKSNADIVIDSVQELAIGGEATRLEYLHDLLKFFPTNTQVLHSLGASEASSGMRWQVPASEVSGTGQVPLSATPNTSMFIEHAEYGEDVFEVWFGGNPAIGYYNNPELTSEKFVERDGRRWWRSGDLVKQVGENEYLHYGRKDDVVKISGYLVSPMSVTNALLSLVDVTQATVLSEKLEERFILHGYVVLSQDSHVSVENIRISLAELIPSYMIPQYLHIVDEIPITIRGKTDRRGLSSKTVN
ncbi:MAG: syringopeptin synthetase c [Actinomycetota bacterium]